MEITIQAMMAKIEDVLSCPHHLRVGNSLEEIKIPRVIVTLWETKYYHNTAGLQKERGWNAVGMFIADVSWL